MNISFTNNALLQQIQQNTLGQISQTQSPLTVKTPANIWPNFGAANQGYSILNNLLSSFGMQNSTFSPSYFTGMNSLLEKFLTIKKPITEQAATAAPQQPAVENTAEETNNQLDIHHHGNGNCKAESKTDLTPKTETPAKPAQAETHVAKKGLEMPKDARILGPTCYLTGGPIGEARDLTPKQVFARGQAQDNNKETLGKLS